MIRADKDTFPIVKVRNEGQFTNAEMERYFADLEDIMTGTVGPYALVFDCRGAKIPTTQQVRRQAQWMKHNARRMDRMVGIAFVISSSAVRGVLRAVLWIQPMSAPYVVVESPEEGALWARSRVSSALEDLNRVRSKAQ